MNVNKLFSGLVGLLMAVTLVGGCRENEKGVIHVAPNGDEAAAGTRSAPLRTLAGAQTRVRSLKAAPGGLPAGGLTVLFAPGTYRVSEAVRFDERDSGSAACPIVYRAEARTTAHFREFYAAIREGREANDCFEYSVPLAKTVCLGNVSALAGKGTTLAWDGHRVTNDEQANKWVTKEYRNGWNPWEIG